MILNKKINLTSKMVGLTLAASAANLVFAEENDIDEEQPKWYEIEVVIFKSTSMEGLKKESWQVDTPIEAPQNLIDFLQSYRLVEGELEEKSAYADDTDSQAITTQNNEAQNIDALEAIGAQSGITSDEQSSTQSINGSELEAKGTAEEKPFQLLDQTLLQLNNEVTSLQRHPEYKVLSHLAWRQPVLGASEAQHIRVAAGADFSLEYNYQGEKRLSHFETSESTNANGTTDIDLATTDLATTNSLSNDTQGSLSNNYFNIKTSQQSDLTTEQKEISSQESVELPTSDLIVPELWVPEIDGDIKIYVSRYLHVKTNLFLRRPDREEVEAIDLDIFSNEQLSKLTSLDQKDSGDSSIFNGNPLDSLEQTESSDYSEKNSTESFFSLNTNTVDKSSGLEGINSQQFSWEIDDDFLTKESEKMYVEKLFNYPLRQSRRMRSKELHYFDHPLFGMLIMITPYEKNALNNLAIEESE